MFSEGSAGKSLAVSNELPRRAAFGAVGGGAFLEWASGLEDSWSLGFTVWDSGLGGGWQIIHTMLIYVRTTKKIECRRAKIRRSAIVYIDPRTLTGITVPLLYGIHEVGTLVCQLKTVGHLISATWGRLLLEVS